MLVVRAPEGKPKGGSGMITPPAIDAPPPCDEPEGCLGGRKPMRIVANRGLGARLLDVDLARELDGADFDALLAGLGRHGVLHAPGQAMDAAQLAALGARLGTLEVNVANKYHAPGIPEVMILSNKRDAEGRALGLGDAGQGWHTDMSYNDIPPDASVLYGIEEQPELKELVARKFGQPGDVHRACELVLASKGLQRTKELANFHAQAAVDACCSLPVSKQRDGLIQLCHVVLSRSS
jgi:hypothetical protein